MNTLLFICGLIEGLLPIEIVWVLTFCFFLGFSGFVVAILLTYKKRFKQNQNLISTVYEIRYHIINFLFENNSLNSVNALKNIIRDTPENSQTIIEILLKIKQTIRDKTVIRVEYLYQELSLSEISAQKLMVHNWGIQIEGIRELLGMDDRTHATEIEKLINHQHPLLRIEAFFAMLHLKRTSGLSLLGVLEYPISDWQQMQIIKMIKERKDIPIPDFSKWFYSSNLSVACFAIRLTVIFNQTQHVSKIAELISDTENALRVQAAIEALISLNVFEFTEQIKALSTTTNRVVQLSILYFLEKCGTEKDIIFLRDFLYDNYLWADDELFISGLRAIKCIINDEHEFFNYVNLYFGSHQEMILQVLEECN